MKHFRFLNILAVALIVLALFGPAAQPAKAGAGGTVYTVTNTSDGHDAHPGDGICATSRGTCTLRAAIEEANADAAVNTINFNFSSGLVHVPMIYSALPQIIHPLILDGTSQPNCTAPCIVISGANVSGLYYAGLFIATDYSVVKGFIITSWSQGDGILVMNGNQNVIQSNDIGFWPNNPTHLPNGSGVVVNGGSSNTIGGLLAGQGNVISGNTYDGIVVGNGISASNTAVFGNYIGMDPSGTTALPNGRNGIGVYASNGTSIGGATAGARNIISSNGWYGMELSESANTWVRGNFIGTNAAGTGAFGNGNGGIIIDAGANTNFIGGTGSGEGNKIAYNHGAGVYVENSASINNRIQRNSIFSNTARGIDLAPSGVTPNDTLDPDTGPNGLQNFPVILSAASGTRVISGRLNSKANQSYTIEFFSSPAGTCDPSTHGEGKKYIGYVTVTTNGSGSAVFTFTSAISFPVGGVITATATDGWGSSSEFSACRVAG